MQKSKQEQRSPDQEGKYIKSAASIHFEKIYLIFMSICFKSFDASHDFLKTAARVPNHVVCIILTIYQSMYDPNQFVFKKINRLQHMKNKSMRQWHASSPNSEAKMCEKFHATHQVVVW